MQKAHVAEPRRRASDRVPTLTEVVDLQHASRAAAPIPAMPAASTLTAEVLFELEQRIHSLFEARLREALAPALARAAEGLIRETRVELTAVLKLMVEDAVTRALERHTHL